MTKNKCYKIIFISLKQSPQVSIQSWVLMWHFMCFCLYMCILVYEWMHIPHKHIYGPVEPDWLMTYTRLSPTSVSLSYCNLLKANFLLLTSTTLSNLSGIYLQLKFPASVLHSSGISYKVVQSLRVSTDLVLSSIQSNLASPKILNLILLAFYIYIIRWSLLALVPIAWHHI